MKNHKKHVAEATWLDDAGLAEITKMRGNFWKQSGFSINRRNFLYPEESLRLAEKSQIVIKYENKIIPVSLFYQIVIRRISLPCYLAYIKLKVRCLEYFAVTMI